ncbi:MAG: Hpt domain-containing protein [Candidatus Brocadiae bacterium]|nr:Hpt domain-containing protein [Candidatus Brocadiia bacterium]
MSENTIVVHIDKDLEAIVPNFLENKRKDIITMRHALENKEFPSIQVLGHRMKGAGGGYGFDEITRIGANLEKAALEKKADAILSSLEELQIYLSSVQVVYEENLE